MKRTMLRDAIEADGFSLARLNRITKDGPIYQITVDDGTNFGSGKSVDLTDFQMMNLMSAWLVDHNTRALSKK